MADNLIFPIGFDLERGVKDAQAQMDSALRRLQKTVDGKPLTIPMSLDASKFTTFEAALRGSIQHITDDAKNLKAALDGSLQTDNSANINRITEAMRSLEAAWKALPNNQKFDINDRLTPKAQEMVRQFNELATASSTYGQTLSQIAGKIKRVADEEAKANQKRNDGYAKLRKTLGAQENSIANLSAKIKAYQQILNSKEIGSRSFERVAEKIRKLTEQLDKAKAKVADLTGQTQSGAARQSAAVKQVTNEFKHQDGYVSRLLKRLAVYASFSYTAQFFTSIREVTAQFELQRVSLGAIIQDQQRANALFSEIKSFALKSPVSIMDLTKYTKQLAAYKVGWDGIKTDTKELFDWTKKLTDVSVGLGVSMDRVVLAFGQTRATGYLRASEIRQFTEMGVPIVEELASKLSKMNGELVTAAQVMDMVSKRGISFELVKEVFDDMTSAGGMFYNMQEKQGNTLFGLWAKLGDAASVMYDEIGNTESVNKGMKMLIELLTNLMKNWRGVANELQLLAAGFVVFKTSATIMKAMQVNTIAAAAATRSMTSASISHRAAVAANNPIMAAHTKMLRMVAVWNRKAALSTNLFTVAANRLKVALVSWGPMAIVAGLSLLISYLINAAEKAGRLKKELDGIASETGTSISRMVTNFESLANRAVKAADGSKEQRDALSELQRTYRSIIPEQELTIAKLREMKGEYSNLTIAIREYIREQQLQKGLSEISEEYGKKVIDAEKKLREKLKYARFESKGGAAFALDENQIDRIISLFKKLVLEGKSAQKALQIAFQYEGFDNLADNYTEIASKLGLISKAHLEYSQIAAGSAGSYTEHAEAANGLTKALQDQMKAENEFKKQIDDAVPALGALTKYYDKAKKSIEKYTFATKENTLARDVETAKMQIDAYLEALQNALDYSGVKIDLGKYITVDAQGIKNFDFEAFGEVLSGIDSLFKVPLINLTGEIKNIYDGFVPTDSVEKQIRSKFMEIANSMGAAGDKMRNYLWNGQGALSDHIKSLQENVTKYETEIYRMNAAIAKGGFLGFMAQNMYGEKIKEYNNIVQGLIQLIRFEQSYVKEEDKKESGGTKSGPRLGILQEMVSTLKQVNKEYEDLAKKEGATKALADTQKIYADTFTNMQALAKQYNFELPKFGIPTDTASLTKYLEAIKTAMAKLPKSQKAVLSLQVDIDKFNIDDKQKQIEEELKRLADQVSRTKTAQEFYDKILGATGDIDLAASVTMSIYGDAGTDVQGQMAEYISQLFGAVDLDVPVSIITSEGVIDYTALEKFATENKKILGDNYKELIKIAQDGQKDMAKTYEGYLKDLEVAKTYADKRIELARTTAEQIRDIERKKLPQAEKQRLIAGYNEREAREAAKLEYEAFKDTPLYTQMFEDLENASTSTLEKMKQKLQSLQGVWGTALDPTQLKEIQSRMNEIDGQLRSRNPFKTLVASVKAYKETLKGYTVAGAEDIVGQAAEKYQAAKIKGGKEAQAAEKTLKIEQRRLKIVKTLTDEKGKQLKGQEALNKAMQAASDNEAEAYVKLNEALAEEKKAIESGSKDEISKARTKVEAAREEYNLAVETSKLVQQQAKSYKTLTDNLVSAGKTISEIGGGIAEIGQSIAGLMEAFGADEEDIQYINDMSNALNDILGGAGKILQSFQKGDIVGTVTNAISSPINMVKGFANLFSSGKVKRANKEIKRQQELLEQLQYIYSRLEYAADKVFGTDYMNNYQQQIKNLQAQQEAYLKQAEAERSKGKKKDKEKIKEYEEQARETADKIKELQDDLVAHFTGSTKTDVARQMAKSWIDARASMSDTFAAIKGDFQDLIKNMLVEGAAARVIENALTPVWDSMQKMLDKNDVQGAIDSLIGGMDAALSQANNGMEVLWKALEARGYDMKKLIGDTDSKYTGIAKSVAGATSEEINNVAAIGNTLMYYVSPIPRMDENLAAIRALLETGGSAALPSSATTGWTDWQQQAMDNYNAIARNTADTVAECRRSAQACESMAAQFSRIIKVKGSITGVNTFLNN